MAVLGFRCCTQPFSSCVSRDFSPMWCTGFSLQWLLLLQSPGSRHVGSAVVHGLSGSMACGIFLDQGSNPRPLHWQVDSYPLCQQGRPRIASPAYLNCFSPLSHSLTKYVWLSLHKLTASMIWLHYAFYLCPITTIHSQECWF